MSRLNITQIQQHRWRNLLHSGVLLLSMGLLLGVVGTLLFGGAGLLWGLVLWAIASMFLPRFPGHLSLRWMGGRVLRQWEAPQLYQLTDDLAREAGLERPPTLAIVPSMAPNAFALGSTEEPYIGVTEGILHQLDRRQLRGVLAHEIAHIRSGDLWVMGLAQGMSRLASLASFFGLLSLFLAAPIYLWRGETFPFVLVSVLLVAPTLMRMMMMALSRTREFEADRQAIALTGDPMGLASALQEIEAGATPWWMRLLWRPRRRPQQSSLWHSHPVIHERLQRLQAFSQETSQTKVESRPRSIRPTRGPQHRTYASPLGVPRRRRRRRPQRIVFL